MNVKIKPRRRGPLLIEGAGFEVYDVEGNRVGRPDATRMLLCRCGQSSTSPLCDGAHNRVGFDPIGEQSQSDE